MISVLKSKKKKEVQITMVEQTALELESVEACVGKETLYSNGKIRFSFFSFHLFKIRFKQMINPC